MLLNHILYRYAFCRFRHCINCLQYSTARGGWIWRNKKVDEKSENYEKWKLSTNGCEIAMLHMWTNAGE